MSAPTLWDIRQHAVSAQLPPGTLVTWALISETVSKQPYNMCDVMWWVCLCLDASVTSVSQVHGSNVFTDYQSHLLCAHQFLAKQLPETMSRGQLRSNIIR